MSKLHNAVKTQSAFEVKKALRTENPNERDNYQQTPLHIACGLFPSPEIVKMLIQKKADVNVQDRNGWTPLHCAANEGNWEICELLLNCDNIDVGVGNRDGTSVLHYLAKNSPSPSQVELYSSLFALYVDKRGDLNSQSRHGEAAIHQACLKGNLTAVTLLLKYGATVNILNKTGESAIHYAILGSPSNAKEVIELLLKNGADGSIKPTSNRDPLEIASQEIKDLLKRYERKSNMSGSANNNNNNNSNSPSHTEKEEKLQMRDLSEYKIKVNVVRAQTLTPAGEKDDANPYCQLMFNKQKFFTTTKNSTLNPKWEEVFYFEPDDISFPIKISIFDQENGNSGPVAGKDDLLGSITLSLTDLELPVKAWYILKRKPKRANYKATPKLRVEVAYELKTDILTETPSVVAPSSTPNTAPSPSTPSAPAGQAVSAFGFKRGKCKNEDCDCLSYQPENERGGQCQNCGHWPAQHTNLGGDEGNSLSNSNSNVGNVASDLGEDEPETKPENVNDIQKRFAASSVIISHTWEVDATELKFTKRLGEGTSAKVFRGTYRGQDVAIKVLKDKAETKVLEEFKKEFEIMSTLRSPHVVFFYGACIQPSLCMVLEFCAKGSLYDVLNDPEEEVTWSRVFKAAQDTVRGLICLHYWKPVIVHRDMKSLNLLVDENWNVKVSDFGTSRFTGGEHNLSTLGKMRGTYAYCAPEVYFGASFTPKSDVFSFGVILWELAHRCLKGTYEQPYSEFKQIVFDFQIIIQSAKKDMRPTIPDSCPPSYTNLICKCWDKDPDIRPETLQLSELLKELEAEYKANRDAWDGVSHPRLTRPG